MVTKEIEPGPELQERGHRSALGLGLQGDLRSSEHR